METSNRQSSRYLCIPGVRQYGSRKLDVFQRSLRIFPFTFRDSLPSRQSAVNERQRLFLTMFFQPAHVLCLEPAVQRMWQADRRANEDVVQDYEWRQAFSACGLSKRFVVQE